MRNLLHYLIISLTAIISTQLGAQTYPVDYFRPPLDIPLVLSGTFGELRTNHFHSGIDIKTQQRTGLPVLAAAEGTVVRIKVSPYGFGKAIYLRHPNGFTTVYAHLEEFAPVIQEYVLANQYQKKTFDIELYPPAGKFQFQAGELIAYSGNSGGSGAPHLHFEIRDTKTEEIINPLLFGFSVTDTRHPDLFDLEVYEFENEELVSNYSLDLIKVGAGEYALAGDELITVNHLPAFGLRTTDRQDAANNRNGIYTIEMQIGGHKYYKFQMERFAFGETRYINSHIDFGQKQCCKRVINKLYLEPNNRFSAYPETSAMNLPKLEPDSIYNAAIRVADAAGNESVLKFLLQYQPVEGEDLPETEPGLPFTTFRYNQTNFFRRENIEITLPEGALYRNIPFIYSREEACADCYSFVHQISSPEIPVHKYYTLKIQPDLYYEGDPAKLVIMSMEDGKPVDFEGAEWDGKFVVARTRQFGAFAVMADVEPPIAITGNFVEGGYLKPNAPIKIIIRDKLSGIAGYNVFIDGKWQLFEYDAKNDELLHDLSLSELEPGQHELKLELKDEVGNLSQYNYHFILR